MVNRIIPTLNNFLAKDSAVAYSRELRIYDVQKSWPALFAITSPRIIAGTSAIPAASARTGLPKAGQVCPRSRRLKKRIIALIAPSNIASGAACNLANGTAPNRMPNSHILNLENRGTSIA